MDSKTLLQTIRSEIERRMFDDYNSGDNEIDEVAQGVCASILHFLDTIILDEPEGLDKSAILGWAYIKEEDEK